MPAARVTGNEFSNNYITSSVSAPQTKAFANSITSGSCLVACASCNTAITDGAVSDSQGNTWVVYNFSGDVFGGKLCVAYAKNAIAGATTVTVDFGVSTPGVINLSIAEYSGVDTTAPYDGTNSSTATTPPTGGSLTTTAAGVLVVYGFNYSTLPQTAGTGYTLQIGDDGSSGYHSCLEDRITTVSGTYTNLFGTNETFAANISIALKESAGGGAPPTPSLLLAPNSYLQPLIVR